MSSGEDEGLAALAAGEGEGAALVPNPAAAGEGGLEDVYVLASDEAVTAAAPEPTGEAAVEGAAAAEEGAVPVGAAAVAEAEAEAGPEEGARAKGGAVAKQVGGDAPLPAQRAALAVDCAVVEEWAPGKAALTEEAGAGGGPALSRSSSPASPAISRTSSTSPASPAIVSFFKPEDSGRRGTGFRATGSPVTGGCTAEGGVAQDPLSLEQGQGEGGDPGERGGEFEGRGETEAVPPSCAALQAFTSEELRMIEAKRLRHQQMLFECAQNEPDADWDAESARWSGERTERTALLNALTQLRTTQTRLRSARTRTPCS